MLENYLKMTFRNIIKYKGISTINIAGLAIGMASCLLILFFVQNELKKNKFHKNHDTIFRVYQIDHYPTGDFPFSNIPMPIAPALKNKYPEIVDAARFYRETVSIKNKENLFYEERFYYTDESFFEIFSFPLILGDIQQALSEPHSILITENIAKKYFGKENPIGKKLLIDNKYTFTVTGILANTEQHSSIHFDFLAPFSFLESINFDTQNWNWGNSQAYILLDKNTSLQLVEDKIKNLPKEHSEENSATLHLQHISKIDFYNLTGEMASMKYIYIFTLIAIFVLLIACINFMNLSTARSANRAKEIGIRKVLGSRRIQLVKQFLAESIFFSFMALVLAIIIIEVVKPFLNILAGKYISANYFESTIFLNLIFLSLITGVVAGCYPALYLSAFPPIHNLRRKLTANSGATVFRRTMVIFQFSISIILIICTGVVISQLNYVKNKNLGFKKENVLYVRMNKDIQRNFESIREAILGKPHILNVTRTFQIPSHNRLSSNAEWEGQNANQNLSLNVSIIDFDYIDTFGMDIIKGRNFSKKLKTDSANYILNEEAIRQMEIASPIGKTFHMWRNGTIIGIVKDYHFMPLYKKIEPLVLTIAPEFYRYAVFKVTPDDLSETLHNLTKIWGTFAPDYPFEYHFLDEDYEEMYRSERQLSHLFKYFAVLAIFISCLGLFYLASYTAEQRTKEIGLRKVLGASVMDIIFLLSKEFTKWIMLANIIAWPIAYFAISRWLLNFEYRTDIGIWIFFTSGILALIIALITVTYQAIRVSTRNPVEALRYE